MLSGSPGPQPERVAAQKEEGARYTQTLASFIALVSNTPSSTPDSRARILEAYQRVLYQYSVAAVSWVRLVHPTLQPLPPSLQPLPAPTGMPATADVDRGYEHALEMRVAMWDIGAAAIWGNTSKMSIPRYRGSAPAVPVAPPLPPFQDARDPRYARLVALTKQADDAQRASFEQQRQIEAKQLANALAVARAVPYSAPQPQAGPQQEQRWCTQSGGGVVGRVPC
ncbi:hypothetical protein [Burkholderia sp. BCC0419]|uniref:hypothetical protein n=1 Tax=Burkholderia sp. BCC0419 TaxID=486878 RepID=UPI001FC8A9F6|nr:hypothetical protein [Burkholderia sp. BCC0419]